MELCPKIINRSVKLLGIDRRYLFGISMIGLVVMVIGRMPLGIVTVFMGLFVMFILYTIVYRMTAGKPDGILEEFFYKHGLLQIKGFPKGHKDDFPVIYNYSAPEKNKSKVHQGMCKESEEVNSDTWSFDA